MRESFPSRARKDAEVIDSWTAGPSGLGEQKEASEQRIAGKKIDAEIDAAFENLTTGVGGLYQGEVADPAELKKQLEFTESIAKPAQKKAANG